jgi:acyl-CoA thioesterase YciA
LYGHCATIVQIEVLPAGRSWCKELALARGPAIILRMAEATTPQPAIRVVMMPRDTNPMGTIFGGLILSYIDQAGVVEAQRHTDRQLVTVAMHEVKFIAPVFVGDLVSFYAELLRIGHTSITIRVTVEAKRAAPPHDSARVTQAEVVYVAVTGPGQAVPVRE